MRDAATDALVERKLVLLVGYADELRPLVEGSASGGPAVPPSDHRLVQQAARRLAADALAYARQVRRWLAAPRV